MITRSLHLHYALGLATFALALGAAPSALAQTATPPAAASATAPAPAATTPASEDEEAKKKKAAAEDEEAKKKKAAGNAPLPGAASSSASTIADPSTTPATSPATATPAPTTSTTVTLGAAGPKKDEPSAGAAKSDAPPPTPWYRGSLLIFDQSMTTNTFSKSAQLSYQPTYEWWISPRVSYNFNKQLRLTVRQDIFKEWTNQGETTDRGEWRYTDSWLSLAYRPSLTAISKNLSGGLGLQLRPGISKESRIAGQYFSTGPLVSLAYNIELGGEKAKLFKAMHLSSAAIYTYAFSRCNTPCASDSSSFSQRRMNSSGEPLDDRQVRTASMAGNQLVYTANLGIDIAEHFDFSASMIWISQFAKGMSDASFGGQPVESSANETRIRQFSWFFTQLSYGVTKEFTVAAGYWNLNNVLRADGKYRNPFWSPDARIFLDIYFHLDAIYEALSGGDSKKKGGGGGGGGSRVL